MTVPACIPLSQAFRYAFGVVAVMLYFTFKQGEISMLAFLGLGPPLLVMAGHLAWLRWGQTVPDVGRTGSASRRERYRRAVQALPRRQHLLRGPFSGTFATLP